MAANALLCLLTLLVLGVVLYGPWQWICTDWARQVVFEKRDAIFDLAADGQLDFRSDEYQTIRGSLQKLIRFAHALTLPRMIFAAPALPQVGPKEIVAANLDGAVDRIKDPEVRKLVLQHVRDAQGAMAIMIFVKSPVFLVLCPFFIIVAVILAVFGLLGAMVRRAVLLIGRIVQAEAEYA